MKFFREILTVLALLLVVALTAALAAPWFIDWTRYRADIEQHLSAATGFPLRIEGHIEGRLLPTPRVSLGGVQIRGDSASAAVVVAESVTLEMAPMPLMRGEVHFTDVAVRKPEITIAMGPDGSLDIPSFGDIRPEKVALDSLIVTGGTLHVSMPGSDGGFHFYDIALDLAAQTLIGPWRGTGTLQAAGRTLAFSFNSGTAEEGRIRLKLAVEALEDIPRTEFDGAIVAKQGREGRPALSLEGQSRMQGVLALHGLKAVWDVAGPLRVDRGGLSIEPLELRVGAQERQLAGTGTLRYGFGDPLAELRIETPRLDIDHLTGAQGRPDNTMAALGAFTGSLVSGLRTLPPVRLSFASPAVTVGGDTLADVALTSAPRDERSAAVSIRSSLPGRASIALDGDVEGGAAAHFRGAAKFSVRDPERLSSWLRAASPVLAGQITGSPFRSVDFAGDVNISSAGFFARNADITADRSRFRGLINYTRAIGDERARIALELTSPALDLDNIPDLSGLTAAAAAADFSIGLDARAVRLARVGQGMIDAGRIVLRARRSGGEVEIEQFDIANLGGASLTARGTSGTAKGRFDLKLNAERLIELAQLLQRVSPSAWSDALAQRAVSLSPATLLFSAQTQRTGNALQLANLSFEGSARGTRVAGSVAPAGEDPRRLTVRTTLSSAQTPMLLRQLGMETVPLERLGESRIEIDGSGTSENGFSLKARASLAGVDLNYEGQVSGGLPRPDASGKVSVTSRDASPLLQVLALALPDAGSRMPVDMSADLRLRNGSLVLSRLDGAALGSRVAGMLAYGADAGPIRKLTGDLRLDTLTLESLASLVLGPRPPARPNMIWPDFRFAAASADPLPTDIVVNAGRLVFPNGATGEGARFRLELGPGLVSLSDVDVRVANGRLRGNASLRRDKGNASLAGQLGFSGPFAVSDFSGDVTGEMEFGGSGPSYAAIAASLGGKGKASVGGLRIEASDPQALARVLAVSDDLTDVTEGRISGLLSREFARGRTQFDAAAFDLALAGGVLTLAPSSHQAMPRIAASLNLRTLALDASLAFFAPRPEGWGATAPEASLRWTGSLSSPARSLGIASLVNGLGARAIEREAARIELLEFEARERAAFNRRIRAREFLQQRETELAAWQVEQTRRAAEEQKRAEEEARRRELEEQRAAARRAAAEAERERQLRALKPVPAPASPPASGAPIQLTPGASAPPQPAAPVLNDPAAAGRY